MIIPMVSGAYAWMICALFFGQAQSRPSLEPGEVKNVANERKAEAKAEKSTHMIVLDGNNNAKSKGEPFDLSNVRTVATFFKDLGHPVQAYFDANVGWKAANSETRATKAEITELLGLSLDEISIVPAGSRADDFILSFAAEFNAVVVSNDRFNDYRSVYDFLGDDTKLIGFAFERGRIRLAGYKQAVRVS